MNIITCKNLTKVYTSAAGETRALDNVSFTIAKGEFVAIMGPSGSGKSTLMNIIGALDTATSGTYLLDGQDVSHMSDDALADIRMNKIGFVFQSFNLLRRTSVLRNVMLPLVYANVPLEEREKRAREVLNLVQIAPERYHHLSNQISGGQTQRVAIARALINNPSLILADEPTGNLDSKTGYRILEAFQKLNREQGHTIVLITHEPDIAEYADRVLMIRDGRLTEDRQTERGLSRTKHHKL